MLNDRPAGKPEDGAGGPLLTSSSDFPTAPGLGNWLGPAMDNKALPLPFLPGLPGFICLWASWGTATWVADAFLGLRVWEKRSRLGSRPPENQERVSQEDPGHHDHYRE